jgi:hypothetical protein
VLTLGAAYAETTANGKACTITGHPMRVCYADLGTAGLARPESWNPSNYFNLGLSGDAPGTTYAESVTALREFGNRLLAFTERSIWYFDPQITAVKRTGAQMGTPSDATIQEDRDGNLLYLGTDMQVYACNGMGSACVSAKVRNRFADKSRYALNLMEFAFGYYDAKESLYVLHRPASGATLLAMRYVVDVYDDLRGEWTERTAPRIAAATPARDATRQLVIGVDTLGVVHVVDAYEVSSTFGKDRFSGATPTEKTSVAGEISPGVNAKGKLAVIFTSAGVRGTKLIVGTQTASAQTEDLTTGEAVVVAAGDKYFVGAWRGKYDTGLIDLGEPDLFKRLHFVEGTFVAGSQGYLWVHVYVDEESTPSWTIRVSAATDRQFKESIPVRGTQFRLVLETASELVGLALRELSMAYQICGDV